MKRLVELIEAGERWFSKPSMHWGSTMSLKLRTAQQRRWSACAEKRSRSIRRLRITNCVC